MSERKVIGLVVAPGVTEKLAENLMEDIPDILSEQHNNQIEWEIDLVVDPLTGYAERVEEIFKKVQAYHDEREWDYVLAITDLPIFHHRRVMALDINMRNGAAIFSYPAFGWRPVKKDLKTRLLQSLMKSIMQSKTTVIMMIMIISNKVLNNSSHFLK